MAPKVKFASPPKASADGSTGAAVSDKAAKAAPGEDKFLTRRIVYGILAFRLILSLFFVKGVDVPDEWWQSTEVAYKLVYGEGHLPHEWRGDTAVRSFIYPLPFAVCFWFLKFLEVDSTFIVWLAPKVVAALIATGIDINTYRIAKFLDTSPDDEGITVGKVALLFSLAHWFTGFITARTQSNVLEALVLLVVMQQAQYVPFLICAGFGCAIRPSSAIFFFPTAVAHWLHGTQRFGFKAVVFLVSATLVVGGAWLGIVALVDRMFYGFWTCTPWNFFVFNVLDGRSAYYGVHPWHWYLTAALPAMALPYTPLVGLLFLPSTWVIPVPDKITMKLAMCCVTSVFAMSVLSGVEHKELRFLYPLVPLLVAMASFVFLHHPLVHSSTQRPKLMLKVMLAINLVLLMFLGVAHRRGPLDVMGELRFYPTAVTSVDVLTSCYNTPGLSHVHGAVGRLRGLDCTLSLSPDANGGPTEVKKVTETDLFKADPVAFVQWVYAGTAPRNKTLLKLLNSTVPPAAWPIPEAVVLYASTAVALNASFLTKHKFEQQRSMFHTLVLTEDDEDYWMELWVRNLTAAEKKQKKLAKQKTA